MEKETLIAAALMTPLVWVFIGATLAYILDFGEKKDSVSANAISALSAIIVMALWGVLILIV